MPRFSSLQDYKSYVLNYVNSSSVEAFTNQRLQNILYGLAEFLADTVQVDPITFLSGDAASTSITLEWSESSNAINYILERSTDNSTFTQIYSGALLTFEDTGLSSDTIYYYRLKGQGLSLLDSDWKEESFTTLV